MIFKKLSKKYKFYYSTLIILTIIEVTLVIHVFSREFAFNKLIALNQENKVRAQQMLPKTSPISVPSPTVSLSPTLSSKYPLHKKIFATMFWVGEKATSENDYIPNESSSWDRNWLEHFGGIDNPYERDGYYPKSFTPLENPFYVALPYDDLAEGRKQSAYSIPWYDPTLALDYSLVKNRWIEVLYKGRACYGQWEDVGPFETDDFEYIFGTKPPKNSRAGIDLSPAMRTCLKMVTNGYVNWQFIDDADVPDGPWKKIVTTSQNNW